MDRRLPTHLLPPPSFPSASRLRGATSAGCRSDRRGAEAVGRRAEPGDAVARLLTDLEPLRLREAPPPVSAQPHPLRALAPRAGPPEQLTPTPSPAAFTLRSSRGRRGNTITITPGRTPTGLGAGCRAAAPPTPTGCTITIRPRPAPTPAPTPNGTAAGAEDGGKRRYPTAEEIQVIGGYESLDRSCLVKERRQNNKGSKVCFDESRLERVCEYPSERAWLACFPCPSEPIAERGKSPARGAEEDEEEEEEEGGAFAPGSIRIGRPEAGRTLKVDESCHR